MVRVSVTYSQEPDPDRYEQHAALCRAVPGGTFRHGPVTRTLAGEPAAYHAEWEFPDKDAFRAAAATEEFAATGADAAEMGLAPAVHVIELA